MKVDLAKSILGFITVALVTLMIYSCAIPNKEVTVQIQINKPTSEDFQIQSLKEEPKPLMAFDVNITKVTVIVKKGTTKVFEQDFTSLNNILFKISEAGNYRIEAYVYGNISGTTKGIFYGIKEQTLNYGTNFVTLEGVFFNATLNFKIESTQSIADKWTYENCSLVLTKNSMPSTVLNYNFTDEINNTPVNFEKNLEIEPGVWKVSLTLKLKNKLDNTEYIYTLPENSYFSLFPSTPENLIVSLQELESGVTANVRVTNFTKPYVEPVRNLRAEYSKITDKLILKWEYPEVTPSTKFQVFKKLKTQKALQLVAETVNTFFETVIGGEFENIEYYAVNVVKDGKESGLVELTDVLVKTLEPVEDSNVSLNINVRIAAIDFAKRINLVRFYVDSVEQSAGPFQNSFSLNTTKYVDGTHFISMVFFDSNNNTIAGDKVRVNVRNWQKLYSEGTGYDIIETNDKNGYIIAAYINDSKIRIIKISKDGNLLWNKEFDGIYIWGRNVVTNTNNGYLICGSKRVTDRGYDGYVLKIDEVGSIVWEKTFGSTRDDFLYSVSKTSDGNYLLGGYKTNTYNYSIYRDGYLLKISETGDIIWEKTYGNSANQSNFYYYEINAVKELKDKRICVVGRGKDDSWVILLDSYGNIIESNFFNYHSWSEDSFLDFSELDDGIVVSSLYSSYYYIRKFTSNASGISERWNFEVKQFSNVASTSDGKIIFPFYSSSYSLNIAKVQNLPTYTPEWTLNSHLSGQIYKVIEDSNKDIVGVGVWNGKVLVVKVKGNGSWYY